MWRVFSSKCLLYVYLGKVLICQTCLQPFVMVGSEWSDLNRDPSPFVVQRQWTGTGQPSFLNQPWKKLIYFLNFSFKISDSSFIPIICKWDFSLKLVGISFSARKQKCFFSQPLVRWYFNLRIWICFRESMVFLWAGIPIPFSLREYKQKAQLDFFF
jgi:hypothetical protein